MPVETRRLRVMPVLREHMQPFDLDPLLQRCIATLFGALIAAVRGVGGEEEEEGGQVEGVQGMKVSSTNKAAGK